MHIIGITGGSGSGKTYVSSQLINTFGNKKISLIQMDSYYKDLKHLSMSEREKNNFDHPSAFDFNLLNQHINIYKESNKVKIPIYDYKTHTRKKNTYLLNKAPILIIEGIFSIYDKKLRNLINLKVFIDTPNKIRKERRIKRDKNKRGRSLSSINSQYTKTVEPMYKKYIFPMKQYSDIIIKDNSEKKSKINKLSNHINLILNNI